MPRLTSPLAMIASAIAPGSSVSTPVRAGDGQHGRGREEDEDRDRDHRDRQEVLAPPRGQPQLHRQLGRSPPWATAPGRSRASLRGRAPGRHPPGSSPRRGRPPSCRGDDPPGAITTTRSASRSTSTRSWVVSRIAAPAVAQARDAARASRPAPRDPCPAVGSSRTSDLGPPDECDRQGQPLALAAGQPPVRRPRDGRAARPARAARRGPAGPRGTPRTGGASRAASRADVEPAVLEHQPEPRPPRSPGPRTGPRRGRGPCPPSGRR